MRRTRFPILFPIFLSLLAVVGSAACVGAQMPTSIARPSQQSTAVKPAAKAPAKPGPKPAEKAVAKADLALLPTSFAGWDAAPGAKPITDPAGADPANAAALKEYGFTDALFEVYNRDGETLKVQAMRFVDASGAYGAYTFYRQSGWPREEIGTGAASDRNRVMFWIGNVLVDSQFPHISAMSAAELRELAATIPVPAGNKTLVPPILGNLPQKNLDGQTTHYALGPAGYAGSGGVLPPELVGFDRGAEAATANYKLQSGSATLTILSYPTPQIAVAREAAIAAYLKAGNTAQHPFTKPLQESNPTALEVRRSGPLVAVVSGDPIQEEAHRLIDSVHWEAVTSPVPGQRGTNIQQAVKLFVGIITLVVIMFVAALMLALFLGGGRALYRFARGKPISSVYDEEFTRLDLKE
jgi:hypothetical protein